MEEKLRECHRLVASVTEAISRARSFRGKWAVIGTKLAHLSAQLTDFAAQLGDSDFSASRLGSELVDSATSTLSEALSLAEKCENTVNGKLRTQSDVDSIGARIERHVADLTVLRESGSAAIGAVDSGDLLTRLQIGGSESRLAAMDSLLDLLLRDLDEEIVAVDLVRRGLVQILSRSLDSSCVKIREKAVSAISRVVGFEICKRELIIEGSFLIGKLMRVLDQSRSCWVLKSRAVLALHGLSFSRENCREIGSKHGIVSLLEVCESGTPSSQAFSAGILRNLSTFPETKQNFMEIEGLVHVLVSLAASGTCVAQENAIGCLCNLISDVGGDEDLMVFVVGEGVLEILMSFMDLAPSIDSIEVAINLLKKLSAKKSIGEAIASLGFIAKLCGALSCGVTNVRISAAEALHKLGQFSKARKEISESAIMIIPNLVKMMEAKIVEEKSVAAKALSSILVCGSNRKIFIEEERAIEITVELLDEPDMDKQFLISVLGLVSNSGTARKQMAAAGVFDRLRRLIEMDIDGAKKLYDNLDRSKTWGLFPRR